MELEVAVPLSPVDFNFDSNCSSPYISAPSSPQRFPNFFLSAPTSPSSASSVPFPWQQTSGIPKSRSPTFHGDEDGINTGNEDFEFDFSGDLQRTSLSAEELFDGGKIRPLKPPPPPRLQSGDGVYSSSPRRSKGKKIVQEQRGFDFDPFEPGLEKTRNGEEEEEQKRGRSARASSFSCSSANSGRKGSRSMSPLRVSDTDGVSEEFTQTVKDISSPTSNPKSSSYASFLSSISFTKGYRKWRLKDFLLFRSASEGRAAGKDPLRKYAVLSKKAEEEVRNSSFRSTESSGSVSSRRRGSVSAHELHYTVNRAASEEMKKKTVLPYKQLGPLGCLGFNPGLHITRGIGSLTR